MARIVSLSLAQLADFDDGLLQAAFDAELKKVTDDLNDRPNDDRPRTISIQFTLKPIARMGELDFVQISAVTNSKQPPQEGRTCTLSPKRVGKNMALMFTTSGTDIRQPGLEFEEDQS